MNYLFLRNKFAWTEVEFSHFLTMKMVLYTTGNTDNYTIEIIILNLKMHRFQISGMVVIITIFQNKLRWKNKTIGIISANTQILGSLLFMFAPNQQTIYICEYL